VGAEAEAGGAQRVCALRTWPRPLERYAVRGVGGRRDGIELHSRAPHRAAGAAEGEAECAAAAGARGLVSVAGRARQEHLAVQTCLQRAVSRQT